MYHIDSGKIVKDLKIKCVKIDIGGIIARKSRNVSVKISLIPVKFCEGEWKKQCVVCNNGIIYNLDNIITDYCVIKTSNYPFYKKPGGRDAFELKMYIKKWLPLVLACRGNVNMNFVGCDNVLALFEIVEIAQVISENATAHIILTKCGRVFFHTHDCDVTRGFSCYHDLTLLKIYKNNKVVFMYASAHLRNGCGVLNILDTDGYISIIKFGYDGYEETLKVIQ